MRGKFAFLAAVAAVAVAVVMPSPASAKPKGQGTLTVSPVTGVADNGAQFVGNLRVEKFVVRDGQLVALGTLTGALDGQDIGSQTVAMPVSQEPQQGLAAAAPAQGCEILDLVLGPLDLDLLGLVVHLDTVHLNITAEPGAGNLLGNLLCAVAGLLDPPTGGGGGGGGGGLSGLLQGIANLLNQILGALQGV